MSQSGHSRRALVAATAALATVPVAAAKKKGKGKGKKKPPPPLGYVVGWLTGIGQAATAGAFAYELQAQVESVSPALIRRFDIIVLATIPITVDGAALAARLKAECAREAAVNLRATGADVSSERLTVTLL